jgi:hypothetical protein
MPYQLIDTVTPDVGAKVGGNKINNNAIQAQYQGGYFTVGGTANAITLTSATGAPSGYATGQEFCFRANATNTGVTTVNVDGLGIKTIKTISGAGLPAGYLSTSADTCLRYDGVNMIANVSAGTLADQVSTNDNLSAAIAGTATFSGDVYTFSPSGTGFRSLQAGMYLSFRLPSGSSNTTTTPDIDYNGTTYTVKWIDGSALEADDLNETYNKHPILFYFDGTDMLIASDISGDSTNNSWLKTTSGEMTLKLANGGTYAITTPAPIYGFVNSTNITWVYSHQFMTSPVVIPSGTNLNCTVGISSIAESQVGFRLSSRDSSASNTRTWNIVATGRWY